MQTTQVIKTGWSITTIHRDVNRAHRHDKKAKLAQFAKNAKRVER